MCPPKDKIDAEKEKNYVDSLSFDKSDPKLSCPPKSKDKANKRIQKSMRERERQNEGTRMTSFFRFRFWLISYGVMVFFS